MKAFKTEDLNRSRQKGVRHVQNFSMVIFSAIIFSEFCLEGKLVNGESQLYFGVEVSSATLSGATITKTIASPSKVLCGALGIKEDWANLVCFSANTCHLYDIEVPKTHQDPEATTQLCYTKLAQLDVGLPTTCDYDGDTFENGTTLFNDSCHHLLCVNGEMELVQGSTYPSGGDFSYEGNEVGCIWVVVDEYMGWDDARTYCQSFGGDLYTTDNYENLRTFMLDNNFGIYYYWIGIRDGQWLGGTTVSDGWTAGEPDNSGACGEGVTVNDHYLSDFDCTDTDNFVCKFG